MNTKQIIFMALLCILVNACKDDTVDPITDPPTTTPKKSQMALLCNDWILKETFEDDVQKTSDGTGEYRFERNGKFSFKEQGAWKEIATYFFNDKDSNSITTNFGGGASTEFRMQIKKLDDKVYNTEFWAGGKKLNYNYVR